MSAKGKGQKAAGEAGLVHHDEVPECWATVESFAGRIGHEVNNPLTCVLINLGWALDGVRKHKAGPGGSTDAFWLDGIESALTDAQLSGNRIAKLMADLGALNRMGPAENEIVNLSDIVDSSIHDVERGAKPRTRFVRQFSDTPPLSLPPARLSRLFGTLLSNAISSLDASTPESNEVVAITRTDEQGRAVTEFRDNGCGMPSDVLARAFEPFFTTRPAGEASGLGLSLCRGIADSIGGTIVLESSPGHGTLARLTLPPIRRWPSRSAKAEATD